MSAEENAVSEVIMGEWAEPLGEVSALKVVVKLGLIEFNVGSLNESDSVATAAYRTHEYWPIEIDYQVADNKGVLTIRQRNEHPRHGRDIHIETATLSLNITTRVPVEMVIKGGVGTTDLNLRELNLSGLSIKGGVGKILITLPSRGNPDLLIDSGVGEVLVERASGDSEFAPRKVSVKGGVGKIDLELPAYGQFPVDVKTGIGSVRLDLPETLGARVAYSGGIGKFTISRDRFKQVSENLWRTDGYEEAANRADISVKSGIGKVSVI